MPFARVRTRREPARAESRSDAPVALLLALATLLLYWPVHGYDFVNLDDVDYVRRNAPVLAGLTLASVRWAFTTLWTSFWMPLTWLSFMVDSQLYGTGPGGYHVTNVLLHVASTILVFLLLARATGRRGPSAFVAGLFALHPLHVESVAWVTERKDVLSTLFMLLTLWCYGRWVARRSAARYLVTLLVFVLGLMAKPMFTTAALLLLVLDLWPLRRFSGVPPVGLLVEKIPFLALALPFAMVTMLAGHHVVARAELTDVPIAARFASACESYLTYLVRTAWPSGLAVLYPEHLPPPLWRTGLAALGLVTVTGVALAAARRRPWVTAGWLWYVVALVPVSGIVRIGNFASADRFTYVPLLGIFVVAAWTANELATTRGRRYVALGLAAAALATCATVARVQLGYWRDGITLFERTIAVTDDNPVVQYMLGLALADRGRTDDAMARYAESLRLRPDYAHAHTSLGRLLLDRGRVDEAIAHLTAALHSDPEDAFAHDALAHVLEQQGRHAEAIAHYVEALRIEPDVPAIHTGYGAALAAQGRLKEAAAEYAAALGTRPDDAEAHNNLANALAAQGRGDEALAHYAAALRLRPDYARAHVNLALFLAERGRFPDAIEHYRAALRLRPDDARLHADLGNTLAAQGKLDDAVAHYTEAIRLEPGYAGAHNNLANALVMLGRVDEGVAQYDEALRLDPDYAEAHYNLGMVEADRGRTAAAIEHYTVAVRIKPDYAAAHRELGILLESRGQMDQARAQLAEALRLDPSDAAAKRALAGLGATP